LPLPDLRRGGADPMGEAVRQIRGQITMAKTNPGEFIRQVRSEAGKVVWPTRQETVRTAIFVAIMMTILAVFFLGIDSLFGAVVKWLLTLA
jgi:preprotein translocase subunit SecE